MLHEYRDYFFKLHDVECNQKYNGDLPYSFHLKMVESVAEMFRHLIYADEPYHTATWIGIYGHDSIEDARLTYNDIKNRFGEYSAEIIFLCTQDKGRNRDARKSDKWYEELKTNEIAVFVKLCDIIANVQFSFITKSSMFKKYKSEYFKKVKPHLYRDNYKEMFDYLEKIFQL